jgi:hypothetical protein
MRFDFVRFLSTCGDPFNGKSWTKVPLSDSALRTSRSEGRSHKRLGFGCEELADDATRATHP